jgi:josephin
MNNEEKKLYHERQRLQLCALHALNCLFQKAQFTKQILDEIVHEYDKSLCWNEYSTLFTGNYDLRIILDALKRHNYTLRAIDINEPFEKFDFKDSFGLLLNIPLERSFLDRLPLIRSLTKLGRHWLTIKSIDEEQYFNFDSKFPEPKLIGNQNNLIEYLNSLKRAETYIYIVIHESMIEKFEQK